MDVDALIDPELTPMVAMPDLGNLSFEFLQQMRAAPPRSEPILSDLVTHEDVVIPGDPPITVRVHRPKDAAGPLPCVYSMHGGGYIMGSRLMDDQRLNALGVSLGCVGVSVEYRLAPETPYPGPLEDCYTGLRWLHEHANDLGVDPDRTGIAGASAGGGLAAGLALLARDRAELPVAFQMLINPMLDDRRTTFSSRENAPIWSPWANEFSWRCYLGDLFDTDRVPHYAAPSRAEDLAGLPPAFVAVGSLDGFLDEDVEYSQRLNHAGAPTELHVYPGAPHAFDMLMPEATVSKRCQRETTDWLTAQFARG